MATVKYLNRAWNVEPRGSAFVLTYAEEPPEQLKGRTLLVSASGVIECKRDGSAEPMVMKRGEPMTIDGSSALFEACKAAT